jgi:hypothetical protein
MVECTHHSFHCLSKTQKTATYSPYDSSVGPSKTVSVVLPKLQQHERLSPVHSNSTTAQAAEIRFVSFQKHSRWVFLRASSCDLPFCLQINLRFAEPKQGEIGVPLWRVVWVFGACEMLRLIIGWLVVDHDICSAVAFARLRNQEFWTTFFLWEAYLTP